MQADWATINHRGQKMKVFVGTLGWSRTAYVEFCDNEKVETLIACHEHAFQAFPGVPEEVLYDNMKTVVLDRNAYGRGIHRFHPGFLDYAKHAGFMPRLCKPYRPKTKGKVERFIGYLKRSFWIPFAATCKHKSGEGYNILLDALPVDRKIVLMPPKVEEDQPQG